MNKIIIITAPSGSGKTSLVKRMLEVFNELSFSISACTRDKRDNEIDGKDYYFLGIDEFTDLIKTNSFVEWEQVYPGKYYGTLKSEFENIWKNGKSPIIDIDVKGALSIKDKYPCLTIFIKVPLELLQQRLEARGTETSKSIKERIGKAQLESKLEPRFDFVIDNTDIEIATTNLTKIIKDYLK